MFSQFLSLLNSSIKPLYKSWTHNEFPNFWPAFQTPLWSIRMLNGNTNVCNAIYKSVKFAYKALLNTETCNTYRIKNKFLEILQNH